ncbi:hypothetical protein PENSUB_13811 [Penicillium subrubescens]|jgi:hypothetical protein|uniref:Uncharacterized protein n=1 Tax=Penicillium subrubescens TaxID=1316194 RepID=A0A1Q5SMX7_9EURO|nr:hypothetical protein PENSUB_13811 [Penicillium subrubescens]
MSVRPETYFEIQAQLTTWTDELEFLGYILCELIDEDSLNTKGYRYHQAADLPATVEILRLQLKEPNGYLSKIMSEDELKLFRRLLRKAKDIRNLMAHHKIQNHERLKDLEDTKVKLSDMLEFAIKGAASDRGIYQVCFGTDTYLDTLLIAQCKDTLVSLLPYLQNIYAN